MAEENVPLALLPTVATAVDTAMNLSPASRNETGLRDEIKHTTAQRSVRMVLWHSDDEPPLMRMVPVDAYNNITAANLEWVVDACGGSVALWCEVWKIVDAGWRVHILNNEKLAVEDTRVAVLVQGGGVERCVNIGVELELLSQFLSKDVESSLSRSLRRNYPACGPGALVYIWTKDGDEPAVFNIPLESDGTVIITTCAAASALWADPEDPQDDLTRINVAMWDSEQTEWCLRRLGECFAVVAAHRTLLIKKSDTTNTVGFGDVLARLDKALRDNALESREKVGSFSPAKNVAQEAISLRLRILAADSLQTAVETREKPCIKSEHEAGNDECATYSTVTAGKRRASTGGSDGGVGESSGSSSASRRRDPQDVSPAPRKQHRTSDFTSAANLGGRQ